MLLLTNKYAYIYISFSRDLKLLILFLLEKPCITLMDEVNMSKVTLIHPLVTQSSHRCRPNQKTTTTEDMHGIIHQLVAKTKKMTILPLILVRSSYKQELSL